MTRNTYRDSGFWGHVELEDDEIEYKYMVGQDGGSQVEGSAGTSTLGTKSYREEAKDLYQTKMKQKGVKLKLLRDDFGNIIAIPNKNIKKKKKKTRWFTTQARVSIRLPSHEDPLFLLPLIPRLRRVSGVLVVS
ncbi:hypothetical protein ACFE04_021987 [Oxalis oulophora]